MSPARRDDGPALILRVTPRGIVAEAPIDQETLAALRHGTLLEAKVLKIAPSLPLRAWWALMGDVVRHEDQWVSPRALSNAILLRLNMVEETRLIGGGVHREPMSLREFSDEQLKRLIEMAKLLIETEIIPGVDVRQLQKVKNHGA